jgi:hypothetical protein
LRRKRCSAASFFVAIRSVFPTLSSSRLTWKGKKIFWFSEKEIFSRLHFFKQKSKKVEETQNFVFHPSTCIHHSFSFYASEILNTKHQRKG